MCDHLFKVLILMLIIALLFLRGFRSWLNKNVKSARKKQEAVAPVLAEIDRLKCELRSELGIPEVLWQSHWGLVQLRSCLSGFMRLYNQNKQDIQLRGKYQCNFSRLHNII